MLKAHMLQNPYLLHSLVFQADSSQAYTDLPCDIDVPEKAKMRMLLNVSISHPSETLKAFIVLQLHAANCMHNEEPSGWPELLASLLKDTSFHSPQMLCDTRLTSRDSSAGGSTPIAKDPQPKRLLRRCLCLITAT